MLRLAFLMALSVCALAVNQQPATSASFHVGNSLTVDSRPQALSQWVPGHSTDWHIRFSMPTSYHVANPNDLDIGSTSWQQGLAAPIDQLVIQPFWRLNDPTATLATETAAVIDLIEYAQIANPDVEVYLFWSWPYLTIAEGHPDGWSGYWESDFGNDPDAPMLMNRDFFEQLHAGVEAQTIATIRPVPVGQVMSYLSQSGQLSPYYGNREGDPIHLNTVGEYIASATLAASMFGLYDLPDISGFFDGLQESDRSVIADAIETVVPLEYWRWGDQDVDSDADTDLSDLLAVQRGSIASPPPAVATIPEPNSLLIAAALLGFARRFR